MNKITLTIILIVAFLIVIFVAFFSGFFYDIYRNGSSLKEGLKNTQIMQELKLDMIKQVSAYGEVKSISGRDLILTDGVKDLMFKIGLNAQISKYTLSKDGKVGDMKNATINDIKNNQKITINFKILQDGSFEASSIIIFNY